MSSGAYTYSGESSWKAGLKTWQTRLAQGVPLVVEGTISRMVGLTLEALGCQAAIGEKCLIDAGNGTSIEAEVVGFNRGSLYLMPTEFTHGIKPSAKVTPTNRLSEVGVGVGLLGRVLDSHGRPIDQLGTMAIEKYISLNGRPINPLDRSLIREPLDTGVRVINSLLTIGQGQRIGLFAGSGVGKSVLLGMMTRFTSADVIVVGLIGERGREVKEFIETILGKQGMQRAVVIVSPSDDPPLKRLNAASLTMAVAEYFRDCGKHVLLLMDSLTRYAQAQREIALAVGEPPVTKGYPPSVFARIPQLVERAGATNSSKGSITGIFTVLVEGDDHDDPIADTVRATMDGHIFLARHLANSGLFPAIDIESSISRLFNDMATPTHTQAARRFRQLYAKYQQQADLISIGAYTKGSDRNTDEAIEYYPRLLEYIRQGIDQPVSYVQSLNELYSLTQ